MITDARLSGILLHPSSLPSRYGIGSLGPEAYQFIDWLVSCGQKVWQLLPLGPTDWSHSPYQCYSAFAGNPDLISLDLLVEDGLLANGDLSTLKPVSGSKINFKRVEALRQPLLKKAFGRFTELHITDGHDYQFFWNIHSWWLESWSLFYACRANIVAKDWSEWDEGLKHREAATLEKYYFEYKTDVDYQRFLQFNFFKQWFALKNYANAREVKIFGDIPLYVSYDSADVWANQELFLLDEKSRPTLVGGVPPDYFSATGQLWGNPLFDWDKLEQRGYDWWLARIHFNLTLFDWVRIDHFRGLESFWAIPANETTAIGGSWMKAHGDAMLERLKSQLGDLPVIAEDLGIITEEVNQLRKKYNLPGMKVLQFAFASDATNEHLPHQHERDFVVYTGTHDNDTTLGWLGSIAPDEKTYLSQYIGSDSPTHWDMMRLAMASVAQIAIIPMQDVLGLGQNGRMNKPGTVKHNWIWKMSASGFDKKLGARLLEITQRYGR